MTETSRWLTDTEQHAWRSFVRLQDRLLGRLGREMQADSGLSSADYGVLVELTEVPEGRLRVLELARALEWEKSRMSHHLNRMAKRGLIVREDCPSDARGAFVAVTPAGREALAAAAPRHVEAVRRLFIDPLTPAELAMLAQISNRILDQLEKDCG
ncbi:MULTISPECIES: MarR family winged helix-turn-helix transcriptional regulator [unclassified Streptomyces]|uniref:MarR family winged helix-turn-helix transcriptional regulator n=1 Tax=unclassified Streptomyces TaxID=2593676 RepID=UPI00070A954E|nr:MULTISPECIES: MarR family transcriptional regulator [unclassified Streptomyces]KRD04685.1 MarR family transcriptional regulator [Streptomyces sp. Root264]